MDIIYIVGLIAVLILANIALAARDRPTKALMVELALYVIWAALAIYLAPRNGAFPPALAVLIIVLMGGLVSRLAIGRRLSHRLRLDDALNGTAVGRRFNARMDLAKARMAERERTVPEHAEEKRKS